MGLVQPSTALARNGGTQVASPSAVVAELRNLVLENRSSVQHELCPSVYYFIEKQLRGVGVVWSGEKAVVTLSLFTTP